MQKIKQEMGRIVAGMYYDSQENRISAMNRIRDVVRKKVEGISFDEVEKKKEKDQKFKKKYTDRELPKFLKQLLSKKKISKDDYEYILETISIKDEADRVNEKYKGLMIKYIQDEKIYTDFLSHIRGISTVISTKLIKQFGYCEKFECISALYSYSGYGVVDGHAPVRKRGEKLNFNVRLRSFIWNIGDSFIKQRTPVYRDIYDNEKKRQLHLMKTAAENCPKSLMHADLRARRKMVKIFMSNFWVAARELGGLKVTQPYVQEHLKHTDIITWQEVVAKNDIAKLKPRKNKK